MIVVEATPIAGAAVDADKIPGNVRTLSAADLARGGSASLTRAMNEGLASLSVNDNLDDPFQPDIVYRGFEASPVLGTPQGLAVYQNGVRINEAFGDTVNWDLVPDVAIDHVELVSSSPVYGLNALGGGISVRMRNGFTYAGTDLELSGGGEGRHSAVLQYGAASEHFAVYVAGKALDQTGWRLFSDDVVRQLYVAISARGDRGTLDFSYTRADNRLSGEGAAPVQELAIRRALVFTGPQSTVDRIDFPSLSGSLQLTESWALQGLLYYRQYSQAVENGNTTDYRACDGAADAGALCEPDGSTPLTDAAHALIPDISGGGRNAIGERDAESIDSYGRGAALQSTDSARILGRGNTYSAGLTLDEALVNFASSRELGRINPQLSVLPSNWVVDTSEAQQNAAIADGSFDVNATPVSLRSVTRYYGAYLTDTVDLTPALSATVSARYNLADIELQDRLGANLTGNSRYSHINPAVGATYKFGPALTGYAGVSENTRAPTASEIECSNPLQPCLLPSSLSGDPPTLRQVVARTAEFGLRGEFSPFAGPGASTGPGGGGSWNLGVFRTGLHDDIDAIATSLSQGYFKNIGDTRRQGIEAGLKFRVGAWTGAADYSYVAATFRSAFELQSASNPFQDRNGDIAVRSGDVLPGIPRHRLKGGLDFEYQPGWTVGATLQLVSDQYYFGDASNQNAPLPGYAVVGLHARLRTGAGIEFFAEIDNLLDAHYATYGIFGNPAGVGAPGIPAAAVANGPGVDNRFQSPAAPIAAYAGVRVGF